MSETILIKNIKLRNYTVTRSLIHEGYDIEVKDEIKRRPIHWACEKNNINIVRLLIKNKSNIEACDMNLKRPIHYSCKQNNIEILNVLIKEHCNIEARDEKDWRPVHYATYYKNLKILRILIQAHCNIEARDKWNMRPIHIAAKAGNIDALKILIEKGCNIESRDRWNKRAIHWAAQYGNIKVLELLLCKGCDIEACDKDKRKAIHWACLHNQLEAAQLLAKHNCCIDARDGFNQLPIDISKTNKKEEIVKLLEEAKAINNIIEVLNLKCGVFCIHKFCPKSLYEKTFPEGEIIGKGSFGEVHKYKLATSNKTFAIKYILNDQLDLKYIENNINDHREKLSHSRIIQYFGAIKNNKTLCIFMEYMKEGSLDDRIKNNVQLDISKIINYSKQILEGLSFLHKNHIIHRDIKPLNILLENSENIKIADFGLSREIASDNYAQSNVGTDLYKAPEIFRGEPYKYPADIWSVGITIIEMGFGRNYHWKRFIFSQKDLDIIFNRSKLSPQMKEITKGMLNFDSKLRPKAEEALLQINETYKRCRVIL